jgi:hypothetical protein
VPVDRVLADVAGYQPETAAFQLVLVAYLQLAAPSMDRVLRHAVSALAPSGMLLVVSHDVTNLADGVGGPLDPALLHTPESITRALSGLTVQRAERVRRPVGDSGREAIDTLVRAVRS